MAVYSFRAEFQSDVDHLFALFKTHSITHTAVVLPDDVIPDVVVELTTDAELEQLLFLLQKIPDSHVIIDTLRPLPIKENHMDRNHPANVGY